MLQGTGLPLKSPDISTWHQTCSSDCLHIKSSCIAFVRRPYNRAKYDEVYSINSAVIC